MLGNLYPALIKWPPGHTPLRFVVAGDDTRLCRALYSDNSGRLVRDPCPPSALMSIVSSVHRARPGRYLVTEIFGRIVLPPCNLISAHFICSLQICKVGPGVIECVTPETWSTQPGKGQSWCGWDPGHSRRSYILIHLGLYRQALFCREWHTVGSMDVP